MCALITASQTTSEQAHSSSAQIYTYQNRKKKVCDAGCSACMRRGERSATTPPPPPPPPPKKKKISCRALALSLFSSSSSSSSSFLLLAAPSAATAAFTHHLSLCAATLWHTYEFPREKHDRPSDFDRSPSRSGLVSPPSLPNWGRAAITAQFAAELLLLLLVLQLEGRQMRSHMEHPGRGHENIPTGYSPNKLS